MSLRRRMSLVAAAAVGIAIVLVVVLGASNLFWISRRLGRGLPEHRVGRLLHVTPARIARAQKWFDRWGPAALIFGRHIPGFRVPITVAAGVLRISYPLFAASVAVSTAIWAGIVIVIGINFGPRMEAFLRVHRETYWLWAAVVLVMIIVIVHRTYRSAPAASSTELPS